MQCDAPMPGGRNENEISQCVGNVLVEEGHTLTHRVARHTHSHHTTPHIHSTLIHIHFHIHSLDLCDAITDEVRIVHASAQRFGRGLSSNGVARNIGNMVRPLQKAVLSAHTIELTSSRTQWWCVRGSTCKHLSISARRPSIQSTRQDSTHRLQKHPNT